METSRIDFGKYSFDYTNVLIYTSSPTWSKHNSQAIPN